MKILKMRHMAQILTVVLVLALTVSLGVLCAQAESSCAHAEGYENGFCIGCGEVQAAPLEDGVYEISNAGQLYYVAQKMRTKTDAMLHAKLTCNVTVNAQLLNAAGQPRAGARLWTPVGNSTTPATNIVLDGQGYYISGLYAKYEDGRDVGLFGYTLNGVTVKNLGIIDSYFYSDSGFVGGIVANAKGTAQIQYCFVDATLESLMSGAGGIAGALDASGDGCTVKYCYTTFSAIAHGAHADTVFENCFYRADSETDSFDGTEYYDADSKLADESTLLENLSGGDKTWVIGCRTGKPALRADHVYAYVCTPECTVCGDPNRADQAPHTYTNECDRSCNVCTRINPAPVEHLAIYPCGTVCRYCGETIPQAKKHQYTDACDDTCDCGHVREQVPHVYKSVCDTTCEKCDHVREAEPCAYDNDCDNTCNNEGCGMTRRAPHAYSAVCDEDCNACGAKRTTTHTYGEFTVTKAAGTLRNGEQTRTCSVCGHVDVQVIPRTGMATGAVVLIGVGVGLVLSVGGFALYWFVFKKRSFAEFLGKK
jgi:hypothetical protein